MTDTENDAGQAPADDPHAKAVLKLADAMLKATLMFASATIAVCVVVFAIVHGTDGLLGALVGGAVAFGSSLATIALMRFCAGMEPTVVMGIVLGSYVLKVLVLLGVMTALRQVSALHPMALAITMLAAFVMAAGAEMRAFKRTKIPTIIPSKG